MFWDYCHFVDDAWWHYYHNENYGVWQQNVDRIYATMRKCMARGTLSPQLKAAMRKREAAQRERDAAAAEEAAQKQRDAAAATEAAAVQEQLSFADEWGGLEMFDLEMVDLDTLCCD
jgi:hypothetical protein